MVCVFRTFIFFTGVVLLALSQLIPAVTLEMGGALLVLAFSLGLFAGKNRSRQS